MANETTMSNLPVVLEATSSQQTITINPYKWHEIEHFGEDASGSSASDAIYLAFERAGESLTVDADASEGANKWKLRDGKKLLLPPGVGLIAFKTGSGSPTFGINPLVNDPTA